MPRQLDKTATYFQTLYNKVSDEPAQRALSRLSRCLVIIGWRKGQQEIRRVAWLDIFFRPANHPSQCN